MLNEGQLRWLQHNRGDWPEGRPAGLTEAGRGYRVFGRKPLVSQVGGVAQSILGSMTKATSLQQRIYEVIDAGVGPELAREITVGQVRRGVLTLYLADPGLLYQVRLQHEQLLLAALGRALPRAGVGEIRFVLDRRG